MSEKRDYEKLNIRLHAAVAEQSVGVCRALLAQGADVNSRGEEQWTPLMVAAFCGNHELSKLLIEKGAEVNVSVPSHGTTPLMWATISRSMDTVRLLLDHGADPNAKDKRGFDALLIASEDGSLDLVNLLVCHGSNLKTEKDGMTPLQVAISKNHGEVAAFMEAVELRESMGKTGMSKGMRL